MNYLEVISKPIWHNHNTGKVKEITIVLNQPHIAHYQAAKIIGSGKPSLDLPPFPVTLKFSSILHFGFLTVFTMWNNQVNFKDFIRLAKGITVIAFAGNDVQRALFRATTTLSRYIYRF